MEKKFTPGSELEVSVDSMAFTGRGVARVEDRVVFVTGAIPGDTVRARVQKKKRRFIEAVTTEVLEPSSDRIKAPCRHFDQCGGCSFQNVPYEKQLVYKREFVFDALKRIGGVENPPIKDIVPCDEQFFYRNKMEFSFLPTENEPAKLGLHVRGRWSEVFDIEECLLQSELSNRIVIATREIVNKLSIPAYHISEHHGFIRFLVIRDIKKTGQLMVNIVTNKGNVPEFVKLVDELRSRFPEITTIVRTVNSTPANVASGEFEEILWTSDDFVDYIGPFEFLVSPTTFLQTNSRQTETLYHQAMDMGDFAPDQEVLDLYCGCGTISHFLSQRVKSVLGVEINTDAIRMAEINSERNGITNCRFVAADAAKYLTELKTQNATFDRVLVDPPRAGMGNKVVRRLARLNPHVIVYVSCNPSTLARDIEQFRLHGYGLTEVVPVDMFPHTYHVESVCRLEKEPAA